MSKVVLDGSLFKCNLGGVMFRIKSEQSIININGTNAVTSASKPTEIIKGMPCNILTKPGAPPVLCSPMLLQWKKLKNSLKINSTDKIITEDCSIDCSVGGQLKLVSNVGVQINIFVEGK
ncbi:MAG: PAAR-like protein [Cetobacterium sp.]